MRSNRGISRLAQSRLLAAATAFVVLAPALAAPAMAVDLPSPDPVEVEVEEPAAAQQEPAQVDGGAPVEGQARAEEGAPVEDEARVEQGAPAEQEASVEDGAPVEGEAPVDDGAPVELSPQSEPAPLAEQAEVGITPFADPAPRAVEDATIRVFKGADRVGTGCSPTTATNNCRDNPATGLPGAVFAAYARGNSQTNAIPGDAPVATCTTDADGQCDLLVDSALGPRYVVVEQGAPTGFRKIDQIALGAFNASGTPRDYRWNVGVTAGQVTTVPQTEIRDQSGQDRWSNRPNSPSRPEAYQWADARDNPPLPAAKCGLNVAMLFDLSGSIGNNLTQVKNASTEFVDDLTGTPTNISLFTFSTDSPQNNGNSQNRPNPVSIANPADATRVKGWINGFSNANGGTNWDAGLRRVAAAGQAYDVLIVLTDGNPTAWEGERGSTGTVNDYDVENAVHSANWVKLGPDGVRGTEDDTRIVSIGISGQAGGLTALNLQHISGTQINDDYYLTTFGDLADVLGEIALNGCGGTINVQKRIAPSFAAAESVPQEPEWPFAADQTEYVDPDSGQTGPKGEPLTFKVTFDQGQLARNVTIREPANRNSTVPVQNTNGKNARCFKGGQEIDDARIVNSGDFGFTVVGVTDKEIISCVVVNSDARLQAVKYQDTNGNGTRDPGEPFLEGWDIFIDDNDNSMPDQGERLLTTDGNGTVLFTRLDAPATYRVCEVLQDGWFNTEPGGGVICQDQAVELQGEADPPAGPVVFGNVEAGGFTITKDVEDESGFVPSGTTYTIEVRCTQNGAAVPGFDPATYSLTDGETVSVGPLPNGAECTIEENPAPSGVDVSIDPSPLTVGEDPDVDVVVTNTYPVGVGEVVKVVDGPLAGELAPPGTEFEVEVSCTFPPGYPVQGAIPGYDPTTITVESGPVGQPGPPVEFGPLPVGSTCTAVESDENGADPFGVTPDTVTITERGDEPVQFAASNTYRPAALRINKVVDGPGAPLVPRDTVYVADVVCTFQGETTFDGEVEFGVDDPGIVSGQPVAFPVGTECTVTEADSQGATWTPPSQTVELVGPDPVLIDVTITNTFGAGELTVEKSVVDPSGLVAEGTQYSLNVGCEFAGESLPGYPQDVVLTYSSDLSQTLTGLPYGTECVVTEPDLNGADSVTFEPGGGDSATVTIDEQTPSVTVTATNTYPAGTFPVTKQVDGEGAEFVPPGTEFEVTATCVLPDGFPGVDPAPFVVTVTDGQTVAVPPTGALPVGTTCTVEETDSAGAGSSTVVPNEVTIIEGDQNVEVVVTNTYPVGSFPVTKVVAGLGANFVPIDTEYSVEVSCTYPADFPASGEIPGFDPLTVVLKAPTFLRADRTALVGPLPVGSECTISEPDPNGAGSVTIDPTTVIVAEGDQNVEVTVTNTYPAGYGQVVKVATGPLAEQLAPEGTVFLVEVSCEFPPGFPAQGDVPGYSPRELAIESGPPGQPGIPTEFGPLPVGTTCSVVETETNGAEPVEITPPGGVTIEDAAQNPEPVAVTVTNTFNPAALLIRKELTGPGSALLPSDTVFKARVVCTFQGETTFDAEVDFSVDNPGEVTDQPEGASCTVTETETNGSPTPPPQTVVLDPPPDPVIKEVTFVNEVPAGELVVLKELTGEAADDVPDGVEFTLAVTCSFQGTTLPGYPVDVQLATPAPLSETLTGLPVGSECFVTETDDGGATSVEFDPPPGPMDPAGQSGTVTIAEAQQEPVSITVRNVFDPALLTIFKEIEPESAQIPPGQIFTATVQCTFEGESIYSGDVPFGVGSPGVVSGLIVGSECTITESESQGATFEPPTQTVIIEGDGDPVTVEVTITNIFQIGELTVEKSVVDPSGLVAEGTQYSLNVGCEFAGESLPGYPQDVVLTYSSDLSQTLTGLPYGTECVVTEPDLNGADSVTFEPGGGDSATVTIDEQTPSVTVTATNTYPAGTFPVTKQVDGEGAEFVPPGTEFEVTATCVLPDGFPGVDPAPYVVTVTDGQTVAVPPTGALPVGTTCTVEETDSAGAGSSTVVPNEVTIIEGDQNVEVVVTNTYPVGSFPITKVIDGDGGVFVPAMTDFTVEVSCTYPADFPASGSIPGFDPLVVTLTTPDGLTQTVGPLPIGAECAVSETESNGAAMTSVAPDSVTVGDLEGPVEVIVTNTYVAGGLTIEKVINGPQDLVQGSFQFDVTCTFLGADLDPQPATATITPPATSVDVDGLPVGAECSVAELAPYGGADGPAVVEPGSVVIGSGDPVTVVATNTFTGLTQTVGPLPVGAECAVAETESNGAAIVFVAPDTVTVADAAPRARSR